MTKEDLLLNWKEKTEGEYASTFLSDSIHEVLDRKAGKITCAGIRAQVEFLLSEGWDIEQISSIVSEEYQALYDEDDE